jgi:hypothetical protein
MGWMERPARRRLMARGRAERSSFMMSAVGRPRAVARGGRWRPTRMARGRGVRESERVRHQGSRCRVGSGSRRVCDALSEKSSRCTVGSQLPWVQEHMHKAGLNEPGCYSRLAFLGKQCPTPLDHRPYQRHRCAFQLAHPSIIARRADSAYLGAGYRAANAAVLRYEVVRDPSLRDRSVRDDAFEPLRPAVLFG